LHARGNPQMLFSILQHKWSSKIARWRRKGRLDSQRCIRQAGFFCVELTGNRCGESNGSLTTRNLSSFLYTVASIHLNLAKEMRKRAEPWTDHCFAAEFRNEEKHWSVHNSLIGFPNLIYFRIYDIQVRRFWHKGRRF
jgi:hypothetical protein